MRYSTYRFSLDLHKHQSQMSIAVFQYDTACRLYISLTDGGIPYLIEDGCKAVFYARRADNTPLSHNCMIEGNARIVYDFKDSTAAIQGITDCQIRLYGKDGDLITAPRFIIVVEERAVREYEIELEDDTLSAIDEIFITENERVDAELARKSDELTRQENESERFLAEADRRNAEEARENAETERGNAESARVIVEEQRVSNENARITAEIARVNAENARIEAEVARVEAENGRVISENARAEAEQARVQAEIDRVNAENARVSAENSREERTNTAIASLTQVYKLGGVAQTLDDLPSNPTIGFVYSVESDFTLNGYKYNAGTNVVYTENGWDALGGMYDLALVSQWDLIITNPADLGKLSEASGNVLVRLEGKYTNTLTITLSEGLKLLDLGGSKFFGATTITAGNANTAIRNLVAAQEYNNNTANLNGFVKVENCNGIIILSNCDYVTNCSLRSASSCNYVVNCSTYPEDPGDVSFEECNLISNLKVNSLEDGQGMPEGTVEFVNCHHISNVHCAEGAENSVNIHYENCTYVDPYTCAGYVQNEDVGKVPVPTKKGGVEFKEFATKDDIGNIEEALRILNEGSATE